jgi:hypothetical protein
MDVQAGMRHHLADGDVLREMRALETIRTAATWKHGEQRGQGSSETIRGGAFFPTAFPWKVKEFMHNAVRSARLAFSPLVTAGGDTCPGRRRRKGRGRPRPARSRKRCAWRSSAPPGITNATP